MKPLSTHVWCFFAFWGRLKRLIAKLILAGDGFKLSYDIRRRQGHRARGPPGRGEPWTAGRRAVVGLGSLGLRTVAGRRPRAAGPRACF